MTYDDLPDIDPWKMFIGAILPNWLLCRSELSFGAKCLYARLMQYKGRTGECYPKIQTLTEELGVKTRRIKELIAELEEHKLLRVDRSGNVAGKPNVYHFRPHPWIDEALGISRDLVQDPAPPPVQDSAPPLVQDSAPQLRESYEETHGEENQRLATLDGQGAPLRSDLGTGRSSASGVSTAEHVGKYPTPIENSSGGGSGDRESRKARALAAEREAAAKAVRQAKENERRRAEKQARARDRADQSRRNLQGDGTGRMAPDERRAVKQIERLWQAEMRSVYPDVTTVKWSGKERGQVQVLLRDSGSSLLVENGVRYVVRNWQTLKDRYLKGKGGYPGLGFLVKFRTSLLPEAELWAKHAEVLDEYEAAKRKAKNPYSIPSELRARYQEAKRALEQISA